MSRGDPLSPTEEILWRALMQVVTSLPRRLDGDLLRSAGITLNEYVTLVSLSEAPGRELRMTDLARATSLSPSRITRIVAELQANGLVSKRTSHEDGRGYTARLDPAGLATLEAAWGDHLISVRAAVFDHVDTDYMTVAARALREIAERLDRKFV